MRSVHDLEDSTELEMPDRPGGKTFRPHWQLFVPTLVILAGYGLSLVYLWATGRSGSGLFRLFAIVAAIGVPLLAAHAFLRYETVRVRLGKQRILFHPGWPRRDAREIPSELVSAVRVKRGLAGRLFGGGTLVIETTTGGRIAVADLRMPDVLAEEIERMRGSGG